MTRLLNNLDLTNLYDEKDKDRFEKLIWLDRILVGSKIDEYSQIELLKTKGIELAIDFKSPDETNFDDESAFNSADIAYLNFPVSQIDLVTQEDLCFLKNKIEEFNGNVFLYCMSANRVGAIISLILAEVIGHSKKRSLRIGSEVGMTKDLLKQKVMDRLLINKESV